MKPTQLLFSLFSLALLISFWACGGDITFPQGPTSGADSLGFEFPQVHVRTQSDLHLEVAYDVDSKIFTFSWPAANHLDCLTFEVILVPSPKDLEQNSTSSITLNVLKKLGTTHDLSLEVSIEASTYLQESSGRVSALLLCVTEELPFPRSELKVLSSI